MPLPPVVALEIGTSKTIALVGEVREDNHIMITGIGEHPSAGVRKGEIIDIENAGICVRAALAAAEESGKVFIRQVHVAVAGGHIQSVINRGTVPVLGRDGIVSSEDEEEAMEVARAVNLPPDREILHTICQRFRVDDQHYVVKPEGMEGARLSLDMLVMHGVRSRLHNFVRVVRGIPLDVEDIVFAGLCSAMSVLTPEQKTSGVVVIDLGGGTTDYIAYAEDVLSAAGSLAVGGDHIANDIVLAFSIPTSRAERLKRESASALAGVAGQDRTLSVPPEVGFTGRSIRLNSLNAVVNARMEEILTTVRRRIEEADALRRIGAGVVLTGGGALLQGARELTERVFGLPCQIGKPRNVTGLATVTDGPQYATCAGLVQYGFQSGTHADPRGNGRGGGWSEFFRGLLRR